MIYLALYLALYLVIGFAVTSAFAWMYPEYFRLPDALPLVVLTWGCWPIAIVVVVLRVLWVAITHYLNWLTKGRP